MVPKMIALLVVTWLSSSIEHDEGSEVGCQIGEKLVVIVNQPQE